MVQDNTKKKKPGDNKKASEDKVSKSSKPKTMEELLQKHGKDIVVPQKGSTVKGKIINISKKAVSVDIGAKTPGLIVDKEFEMAKELVDTFKVGDELEAVVFSTENDKGYVLLSLKRAAVDAKWKFFEDALESGDEIEVKGVDVNKGGLIVLTHSVRGFVPSSQFSKKYLGKLAGLRGKKLSVKVIEVDKEKNRLIFSERHVSEADELEQKEEALNKVHDGEVYEGTVSGVMPFGLFVTVKVPLKEGEAEVEGLVHISEISWEKVEDPKDYHKAGDVIKVKVLGTDEQTGKLNLSIKQLTDDPWKSIEERYSVGTTFVGKVSRIEPFGVFINVEPGVDGLMHQSKMERDKQYNKGDEITVNVESIDAKERRMSLSPVVVEVPVTYK